MDDHVYGHVTYFPLPRQRFFCTQNLETPNWFGKEMIFLNQFFCKKPKPVLNMPM